MKQNINFQLTNVNWQLGALWWLKIFIEGSNDIQDIYKTTDEYNPGKRRKILMVLDDMIAAVIGNNNLSQQCLNYLSEGTKSNLSIVCITQSYFKVSKDVRLNSPHYVVIKKQFLKEQLLAWQLLVKYYLIEPLIFLKILNMMDITVDMF